VVKLVEVERRRQQISAERSMEVLEDEVDEESTWSRTPPPGSLEQRPEPRKGAAG